VPGVLVLPWHLTDALAEAGLDADGAVTSR
jgi:hypothetical protein